MLKFLTLTVGLGFLVIVALTFSPQLSEEMLEWDCPEAEASPSEDCLKRIRAAGHVRSQLSHMPEAERFYLRGANAGDPIAMFHLAWVYEELASEFVKDRARQIAKQLSEERSSKKPAQYRDQAESLSMLKKLALVSEYGAYSDQAVYWYKKSADLGFAPSMNNLAQIYAMNPLRKPQYNAALRLHKKAAKAGNPIAHWNIGMTYASGRGMKADPRKAEKWWTWKPGEHDTAQFASPTLERTRLFGRRIPQKYVSELRHNAANDLPVTVKPRKLRPSGTMPNFDKMRKELERQAKQRQ